MDNAAWLAHSTQLHIQGHLVWEFLCKSSDLWSTTCSLVTSRAFSSSLNIVLNTLPHTTICFSGVRSHPLGASFAQEQSYSTCWTTLQLPWREDGTTIDIAALCPAFNPSSSHICPRTAGSVWTFPTACTASPKTHAVTEERLDNVIRNVFAIHIAECTIPFEAGIENAASWSPTMYAELVERCCHNSYQSTLATVKVNLRGLILFPTFNEFTELWMLTPKQE